MIQPSWKEKWASIQSKFETCIRECRTAYRSDIRCKDSIEAVVADIWNLREWLKKDPAVNIPDRSIEDYIYSHIFIRACGDIELVNKHYRIGNQRHEETNLILEATHCRRRGFWFFKKIPIVYKVVTKYKDNPGNIDTYEDAPELAYRAIKEWKVFLEANQLL